MTELRPLRQVTYADPYRPPVERNGVLVNEMRRSPNWTLHLDCGHTITRPKRKTNGYYSDDRPAPQQVRCDHCPPEEDR